jgi:hypothetical protein
MLDEDLADFYGVTTGNLNKAVSRNNARFPEDFMFQLTKKRVRYLAIPNWEDQVGVAVEHLHKRLLSRV